MISLREYIGFHPKQVGWDIKTIRKLGLRKYDFLLLWMEFKKIMEEEIND